MHVKGTNIDEAASSTVHGHSKVACISRVRLPTKHPIISHEATLLKYERKSDSAHQKKIFAFMSMPEQSFSCQNNHLRQEVQHNARKQEDDKAEILAFDIFTCGHCPS